MKKAIGIIILGLLWCNVGFALSQQQFIDQYLSGKKLDQVEGVWINLGGNVYSFYKSGSQYYEIAIRSNHFQSGETVGTYTQGSETTFYGNRLMEWVDSGRSVFYNNFIF